MSTHGEEVGAPLGLLAHRRGCVGGLRHVDAQLLLAGAGRGRHRRRVVAKAAAAATATAVARLEAVKRENHIEKKKILKTFLFKSITNSCLPLNH